MINAIQNKIKEQLSVFLKKDVPLEVIKVGVLKTNPKEYAYNIHIRDFKVGATCINDDGSIEELVRTVLVYYINDETGE